MPSPASALKTRFLRFRRELITVAYAVRHPDTPTRLRIAGIFLLAYLLSPIDLVPVLVPVFGLLDDLILVPWGVAAVVRRLPPTARSAAEEGADRLIRRWVKRPLFFLALFGLGLLLIWSLLLWILWRLVFA